MSSSTLESVCWLVWGCYINFSFLYPVSYNPSRLGTSYLTSEIVIWDFLFPKLSWFRVDLHSLSHTLLPSICIDLFRVYSSSSDSHIGTYLPTCINRYVMVQCQVRSGKVQVPDRWYPVQSNARFLRKPEMSTTIRDIVLLCVSAFSWLQKYVPEFFFVLLCVSCVIGWTIGKK